MPTGRVADTVQIDGDGRPLVLLHGGPGLSDYMALLDDETVGWRRIRYQQRGIAPSPESAPFTVARHLDDLSTVLDAADVHQAVVLGHSWGGHLALHAAARLPDRVAGVVAVDPLGAIGDGGADALGAALMARLLPGAREKVAALAQRSSGGDVDDGAATERLALVWPGYFAHPPTAPPLPPGLRLSVQCHAGTMASVRSEIEGGFPDRLAQLRVPVEIVLGAQSPLPNEAGITTAALIPRCGTTIVPGAGHLPWHEQPGCVRQALRRLEAELD
ncbi:MAG TPA: alpha/beta hydrolase [Acidimicrobiales bacterium]|nr:alpha/beta hydrolase [Acidimicrobiales bacterium]